MILPCDLHVDLIFLTKTKVVSTLMFFSKSMFYNLILNIIHVRKNVKLLTWFYLKIHHLNEIIGKNYIVCVIFKNFSVIVYDHWIYLTFIIRKPENCWWNWTPSEQSKYSNVHYLPSEHPKQRYCAGQKIHI